MNGSPAKRERISSISAGFAMGTALCVDSIQFLLAFVPLVGIILNPAIFLFGGLFFWFWFRVLHDVTFITSALRMGIATLAAFFEFFPTNFLPALSASIALTILVVWWEDREYNKVVQKRLHVTPRRRKFARTETLAA